MPTGLLRKKVLKAIHARRQKLPAKVVAITGTAGKSTTKSMISSILEQEHAVLGTLGNANLPPHVAGYISKATPDIDFLVLEMGMDRRGHIAQSSFMASPDVAVVTNVSRGHMEKCGGFSGVIKAKNEIIRGMGATSVLAINLDDRGSSRLNLRRFPGRIVTFGRSAQADYRLLQTQAEGMRLSVTIAGEGQQVTLLMPTIGEHNGYNAAAAIAVTRALCISWDTIKTGLTSFKSPRGRLTPLRGLNGALVIDDSFNANPLSVEEGLKTLAAIARGRETIAVLGNMEEQGDGWRKAHIEVGRILAQLGINHLVTVGKKARYIAYGARRSGMKSAQLHIFRRRRDAQTFLQSLMNPDAIVFIKGSHSTNLFETAKAITERGQA